MAVRLAWHASGTYDKADRSGGSNGATMRFAPESTDDANAGLNIIRDLVAGASTPNLTVADKWIFGGALAVEFTGGPKIPFVACRADHTDGSQCPPNGRLPDASQGAQHLRDVFYRMGFDDKEIVALSGAHTLGRCHRSRSGYDGPWTTNPLRFDNEYFRNLINLEWKTVDINGKSQFADVATGKLMMLPTDMALITDPSFRPHVEAYAKSQELFFHDFSLAFAKLLALGTPSEQEIAHSGSPSNPADVLDAELREAAMHGSLDVVIEAVKNGANVNSVEWHTGRSALHKAAFWGHDDTIKFLLSKGANKSLVDSLGHTALDDATKFNHKNVMEMLR